MANRLSIIFLFLIISLSVSGNPYIDSLKKVERTAKFDSTKLHALGKLGRAYLDSNYTISLQYFNSALLVATKLRDKDNIAFAHQQMGAAYFNMGEFNESIKQFSNAITVFQITDNTKSLAHTYNDLGLVYKTMGKYVQAIEYYSLALGNYEIIQNKHGIGMVANNIGQIFFYRDDFQNAIQYFSKYLNISKDLGKHFDIAGASNNIAAAYIQLNNYEKAYEYYQNALFIYDSLNIKSGVAVLNDNIGSLYANTGNFSKALDHHLYALSIFKAMNSKTRMAYNLKNIGHVYLMQKKYNIAIDYFQQSKSLALEYSQLETLKEVYFFLEQAYAGQDKYFEALANYKLFVQIRDSLMNQEAVETIASLELQHESDRKSRDLEYLQAKFQQQKVFNLSIASIGFVFFLFLLIFAWDNRSKKKQLVKINYQNVILNNELNHITINNSNLAECKLPYHIQTIALNSDISSKLNFIYHTTPRYFLLVTIAFESKTDEIGVIISGLKRKLINLTNSNLALNSDELLIYCKQFYTEFAIQFSRYSEPTFNVVVFDLSNGDLFIETEGLSWIVSQDEILNLSNTTSLMPIKTVSQIYVLVSVNTYNQNSELSSHISKALTLVKNSTFNNQIEVMQSSIDFWKDSFKSNQDFFILAVNVKE
jgi:tetratricopeptide (TPR) repeat protein